MDPIESSSAWPIRSGSPPVLLVRKQTGSPIRFRTYDPFVNSPADKSFVFWVDMWLQRHSDSAKPLFGSAKQGACAERISSVFHCIFLLLQQEMRSYVLQRGFEVSPVNAHEGKPLFPTVNGFSTWQSKRRLAQLERRRPSLPELIWLGRRASEF
jgi:hypothetical protein